MGPAEIPPLEPEQGQLITVRPGRTLFVRTVRVGAAVQQAKQRGESHLEETLSASSESNAIPSTIPPEKSAQQHSAITLFFVHGLCSTEQHYHPLLQELHQRFASEHHSATCVLYDMAGCGHSPQQAESESSSAYTYEESKADLEALLARNCPSPSTPFVVLGHSYAANLILPLLLEQNRSSNLIQASGIALLSCGIRTPSLSLPDGGVPLVRYLPVPLLRWLQPRLTEAFVSAALHPSCKNPRVVDQLADQCNGNDMAVVKAYHRNSQWISLSSQADPATLTAGQGNNREDSDQHDSSSSIAPQAVLVPTRSTPKHIPSLVLHGACDAIIPLEAGRELAQALSTKVHVVDNASHMIALEQPAEVARSLLSFLQQEVLL